MVNYQKFFLFWKLDFFIQAEAEPTIKVSASKVWTTESNEIQIGDIWGVTKHHDFLLRINLNKNLDYDGEFEQIGGTVRHTTTYDSTGRQSKKIVIEYDVTEKSK